METGYQKRIKDSKDWDIHAHPRYVEAWMRLYFGTFDNLSANEFDRAVGAACECVRTATVRQNHELADSFGL